ncbi:hypothetical protein NPX88_29310, partial [Bacillus mycoides]|nr:hypothetical protein [Bacillus mycoides]
GSHFFICDWFIPRSRAYHCNNLGAIEASGQAQRKYKNEPLGQGFLHVAPPATYRKPEEDHTLASAQEIDPLMTWEL